MYERLVLIRELLADTPASSKQFILLVGKGKEGWNCRSLFGVALHRKPDSRIFVLQATMRCLSEENLSILDEELEQNFRLSVDAIRGSGKEGVQIEVRLVPPPAKITLKRVSKLHQLEEKSVRHGIDLQMAEANTEAYRVIHQKYKGLDLTQVPYKEDVSYIREQREFSEITLVAEISRYLNKPPLFIRSVLASTQDGIPAILKAITR